MRANTKLSIMVLVTSLAGFVLFGCGGEPAGGNGGAQYIFKALNTEVTDYDAAAAAEPQSTFTDADASVFVYFFGPFNTGDRWFIRLLSPSGEGDRVSDTVTVTEGSSVFFVSAGQDTGLYTENGEWEIVLVIHDERIGSGTITIDRDSLP